MREFFLNLLNNLDKLCGLKQLDKIYASHGEDMDSAKSEIKVLLDVLCRVSTQFPFISEHEQQKIISQAVITEEFPSLNAHVVYTWLAKHKDKYFKESHHVQEVKPGEEPLTGEARQAKLQEWLKSLASTEQMIIHSKPLSRKEIEAEGKEWASDIERKALSTRLDPARIVYTPETIKQRNARIRELQERAFRERNPGASEEDVQLFLQSVKKYEIPEV